MLSSNQVADFYLVQIRLPNGTVEQVSGMEYSEFPDAVSAANRLSAWLRYGHGCHLPEDAIDLRDDLLLAGEDPFGVDVEVVYPAYGAENGFAVACLAMATERGEDLLPDTVIEEIVPVLVSR